MLLQLQAQTGTAFNSEFAETMHDAPLVLTSTAQGEKLLKPPTTFRDGAAAVHHFWHLQVNNHRGPMRMIPCAQARSIHSESFTGSCVAAFRQVLEARIVGMRTHEDLWFHKLHQQVTPGRSLPSLPRHDVHGGPCMTNKCGFGPWYCS